MERLTIRMDHGVMMAQGYDFGIDPDDFDIVQKILDRLAAYEDTNLTPEEIHAAFGAETLLNMTARYLGVDTARLKALADGANSTSTAVNDLYDEDGGEITEALR